MDVVAGLLWLCTVFIGCGTLDFVVDAGCSFDSIAGEFFWGVRETAGDGSGVSFAVRGFFGAFF